MIWEDLITQFAGVLSTTTTVAGAFISLVLTMGIIMAALIATSGKNTTAVLVSAIFSVLLFTTMGWFEVWLGAVLALPLAALTAWWISNVAKTGGGD